MSDGVESFFSVDRAACVKCGACVRDCAFRALKAGKDGYPEIPSPEKCMRCQHCFAICPRGAITFAGHRAEDAPAVADLPLPRPEEVANWLKVRRSIRRFKNEDVDRGVLESMLSALGNVPTGCNARGLTFTCISTRASMDGFRSRFVSVLESYRDGTKLLPRWLAVPAIRMRKGGVDIVFGGAPGMLVVTSDERNPGVTTPEEDVISAVTTFGLLANANGIGTCWCGFLSQVQKVVPAVLEKTLGIRRATPFYAMLFGYPAVAYRRAVMREGDARTVWL